jgi:hypothetical protein
MVRSGIRQGRTDPGQTQLFAAVETYGDDVADRRSAAQQLAKLEGIVIGDAAGNDVSRLGSQTHGFSNVFDVISDAKGGQFGHLVVRDLEIPAGLLVSEPHLHQDADDERATHQGSEGEEMPADDAAALAGARIC